VGELTALRPIDEHGGLVDFSWQIRNQDDALVARATVQVLWRRDAAHENAKLAGDAAAASWREPIAGDASPGEFAPLPL